MKKFLIAVLVITLLFSATPALADVIWEPDDDFYLAHQDECEYVSRTFVSAGPGGEAYLFVSPEDLTLIRKISNGERLFVEWQWEDWYYYDGGWLHSDNASLVYDNEAFMQDNTVEEAPEGEIHNFQLAMLYTYPNSGQCYELSGLTYSGEFDVGFDFMYTDDNGLVWGYFPYLMQHEGWICVDDPTNENLSSGYVPEEPSVAQQKEAEDEASQKPISQSGDSGALSSQMTILIVASALIVAVAGVTLFLLIRRKKSR